MESMVAANMCSRPTRTLISVIAVAIGVILMLIIGGIVSLGILGKTVLIASFIWRSTIRTKLEIFEFTKDF